MDAAKEVAPAGLWLLLDSRLAGAPNPLLALDHDNLLL